METCGVDVGAGVGVESRQRPNLLKDGNEPHEGHVILAALESRQRPNLLKDGNLQSFIEAY